MNINHMLEGLIRNYTLFATVHSGRYAKLCITTMSGRSAFLKAAIRKIRNRHSYTS
jgi:hypothetical protein